MLRGEKVETRRCSASEQGSASGVNTRDPGSLQNPTDVAIIVSVQSEALDKIDMRRLLGCGYQGASAAITQALRWRIARRHHVGPGQILLRDLRDTS